MKKSLLALAVLGAFAGVASAQSSVTVYGIVDVNVTSTEQGGERVTDLSRGAQSPSRIGFKGVEDLGNGLKASFVLENGFDSSDGSQTANGNFAFQRNAWVGLDGGFGTVRFGRQDTPIYLALDSVDPFGTGTLGDIGTLFESLDNKARTNNLVYYKTPTFGGFAVEVDYAFGEVAGENTANRSYGIVLGYENGPLTAKLAYNELRGGGDSLNGILGAIAPIASTDPDAGYATTKDAKNKDIFAGATYDFGAFKLHGAYLQSKFEDADFFDGATTTGTPDFKLKSGMIGVSVPLGAGTFLADYTTVKNDDVDNADSKKFAIGYSYALSKRTNLYTVVSRVTNDDNVGRASYGSTDPGDSSTGYQVGLRHSF